MARIEGVDLPRNKRIEVALTYIYGIGPTRARQIILTTKVNADTRVKELQGRRRPAPRGADEYQAPDRNWLLPWFTPSP